MNLKCGIMTKQILITLEKQLIYFPGKKTLRNMNINDMMFLFNQTVKIIISTNIPYTTVTFDDRDPPWINKKKRKMKCIKNMLKKAKTLGYLTKLNVSKPN